VFVMSYVVGGGRYAVEGLRLPITSTEESKGFNCGPLLALLHYALNRQRLECYLQELKAGANAMSCSVGPRAVMFAVCR
jgi:hypothetical protein